MAKVMVMPTQLLPSRAKARPTRLAMVKEKRKEKAMAMASQMVTV